MTSRIAINSVNSVVPWWKFDAGLWIGQRSVWVGIEDLAVGVVWCGGLTSNFLVPWPGLMPPEDLAKSLPLL
jgi:hypothetical protein